MSMTPEAFDKFLRGDIVKWAESSKHLRIGRSRANPSRGGFAMPSVAFASMAPKTDVEADPDSSLLAVLRGLLGVI